MSVEVVMPQMGESITEGTVSKWLKSVGERVEKDEAILEISTDKVDAEVPSPTAGVLLAINTQEGETVEVGTVVAVIGESADALVPSPKSQAPASVPSSESQDPSQGAEYQAEETVAASPAEPNTAASISENPKSEIGIY